MKKNLFYYVKINMSFALMAFIFVLSFVSCQTEMELTEDIVSYKFETNYETTDIEFIGFKASDDRWDDDSRTYWGQIKASESIQNFGSEIQESGIAIDKTGIYFGDYSFSEMKEYKGKTRYVSFVEIPDFMLTYKTNNTTKSMWFLMGSFGVTAPICWPVSVAIPAKTNMNLKTSENIYVYDTQNKEVVYKKVISINEDEEFKGIFGGGDTGKRSGNENWGLWPVSSESSRQKVYGYWAGVIANKALAEYENIRKNPNFKVTSKN